MENVQLHRVVLFVLGLNNDYTKADLKHLLESKVDFSYIKDHKITTIENWTDNHELNKISSDINTFNKYFPELTGKVSAVDIEMEKLRDEKMSLLAKINELEKENKLLSEKMSIYRDVDEIITKISSKRSIFKKI